MPDTSELLQDGLRYQKAGALDKALAAYRSAEAAAAEAADAAARSEARRRQSVVLRTQCAWDAALEAARGGAEAAREAGLRDLEAEALNAEAAVFQSRGEYAEAEPLFRRMLDLASSDRVLGVALQNLGSLAAMRGDHEEAERRFLEATRRFRSAGYRWGEAHVLNNYGRSALERGAREVAERVLVHALEVAREVGDTDLAAVASTNLGEALAQRGADSEAEAHLSAALGYFTTAQNTWRRVECLRLLGDLALRRGDRETAVRSFRRGLELARSVAAGPEARMLEERLSGLGEA